MTFSHPTEYTIYDNTISRSLQGIRHLLGVLPRVPHSVLITTAFGGNSLCPTVLNRFCQTIPCTKKRAVCFPLFATALQSAYNNDCPDNRLPSPSHTTNSSTFSHFVIHRASSIKRPTSYYFPTEPSSWNTSRKSPRNHYVDSIQEIRLDL